MLFELFELLTGHLGALPKVSVIHG
jgi:hypothetical protein